MIHLFFYMYYQILFVNFLSEHCIYFMIVSFNSWCHVCNRFYQLNLNVDVDVFVVSTPNESERKSNKRIRNGF